MTDLFDSTQEQPQRVIYSVERLNSEIRDLLEHSYPLIWLEAEISNFSRPASGHWYFTLKDQAAQVRCAMFRNRNQLVRFTPDHGTQVLVRARISLYPARGDFQLIIEHMEEAGAGALQRAYEALKQKLQTEGLFAAERKQTIPEAPARIGVITSPTGAAIRDVLSVLRRRYPLGEVIVYPVPVQGDAAAPAIIKALQVAAERNECDLLLLVRGGGSLEDLWAFNEEAVARAIHACPLPIINGVGHEVDFTIADFVADQRAPTPTAAAELATPNLDEWQTQAARLSQRLAAITQRQLNNISQKQDWLAQRLKATHPGKRLQQHAQRMDELEQRLTQSMQSRMLLERQATAHVTQRLTAAHPGKRLPEQQRLVAQLLQRLNGSTNRQLEKHGHRLGIAARALDSLSPLKTLDRGYAIATTDNQILHSVSQVNPGDHVELQLAEGKADCTVDTIHPMEENRQSS